MRILFFVMILNLYTAAFAQMENNAKELSKHYTALPNLYVLDNTPTEKLSAKLSRQYIMGSQSMLVKWTMKKDAIIPLHFHPNEQTTWITKGSVKVISQSKTIIVKAGEVLIIPPYVPHEFHALEDTIDIDFFTPVREDWVNNTAIIYKK